MITLPPVLRTTIFSMTVLLSGLCAAQSPQKFSSQLLVRNASNELITEDVVRIRVSILQTSPTGTLSYSEIHTPFTNANGLASLEIGTGTNVIGSMSDIDWSDGPFFIRMEVDPTGGTNYTVDGTTELLSVPYALHAGSDGDWEVDGSDVYVPSGKNIGIGTSSPDARLEVTSDALINGLTIGTGSGISFGNTALGNNALNSNTLGDGNTAVGLAALANSDWGSENTAIGWGALGSNIGGSENVAIGYSANVGSSNLSNATAIGAFSTVSQSNSLILGSGGVDVGIGVTAPNEKLEIGDDGRAFFGDGEGASRRGLLIDGIQGENAARIEAFDYGTGTGMDLVLNTANSSGLVGIRTNNPSVSLDVSGSIEYTGTITDVSDKRLKEDFRPIEDAIASLSEIQGYSYVMKEDPDLREYGVIAQEVQKVFPEMVTVVDEENGYLGVSYIQLIPVLLEAMKEQNAREKELSARLDSQEELIEEMSLLLRTMSTNNSTDLTKGTTSSRK